MATTQFDLTAIHWILLDIEGTTTSVAFVYERLFPYAQAHMATYCTANADNSLVQQSLDSVLTDVPDADPLETLTQWMSEDKKHAALKTLQGLLWEEGYRKGELKGHVYADVPVAFERWQKAGKHIGIYSSGSVLAQHLLFEFSVAGNLRPYLEAHFDTRVGHKQESTAYTAIADQLNSPPGSILFVSDIAKELVAAEQAGYQVCHIHRPNHPGFKSSHFPTIQTFDDL